MHMRCAGRGGRSLLIDYMPLEQLLATYPELKLYVEDGSIVYFEACLTQMRQGDIQLLVQGLLGISWSKLNGYHVSLAALRGHGPALVKSATGQWKGLLWTTRLRL